MTGLQVLGAMARKERPLSELAGGFERFPQVVVNVGIAKRTPLEELPVFQEAIAKVEAELGDRGRVLIRYSGTELKARVMVEGEHEARVRELAHDLADDLKRALAGA
jgi:phosphoglucosamine mutase